MISLVKEYFYDKRGVFKIGVLKSPLFLWVLILKIVAAFLFASHYLYGYFVPFVKQFVYSGFENPYTHFWSQGFLDIFPYPKIMLFILSFPMLVFRAIAGGAQHLVGNLDLFLLRVPIIVADIAILLILARWLKNSQKSVLLLYWCSPILFYINYVHGQLDVLPIMLLFVFLYFLFKEKYFWSILFLGLAISTKTGILVVLPFVAVYLWSKRIGIWRTFLLVALPVFMFFVINLNYLVEPGFIDLVLKTKEQFKVFDFQFHLSSNFVIYIVPLVYLFLFTQSLTYKTFSKDLFLIFLGFSFGILTIFISPMPGWYYWVIPFLIYFFVKLEKPPAFIFLFLNIFYFAYFLVIKQSDLFEVFSISFPQIATLPNFYNLLVAKGFNADLVVGIIFSLLQGTLLINVWWIYKRGVQNYLQNKIYYKPYLIGIAGDSGSGKSTLAGLIGKVFKPNNVSVITGDDLHKWERGNRMWTKYTHLDPRANELHEGLRHAHKLKEGDFILRRRYDHDTGQFTLPTKFESKKVVIFEGLHSLFLNKMRNMLDLKIFMSPEEDLRIHWKVTRDTVVRGQSKAQVAEALKKRENDAEQFIKTQEKYSDIIVSLKGKKEATVSGGQGEPPEVYLEVICSNSVDLSRLLDEISRHGEVSYLISDEKQIVKFTGNFDRETISNIGFLLVPEIEELAAGEPEWQDGNNGLIQLFVSFYIFETMRVERYGR